MTLTVSSVTRSDYKYGQTQSQGTQNFYRDHNDHNETDIANIDCSSKPIISSFAY